MASGDKQYIADKETLDAIKALIGLINDTGGTSSAGTLMAKLNAVINYVLTNNSGSSTGTLSQKLTYIISTLLGTTGATGGSATAGTLSAKANKIINDVASIISKIDSNGGIIPYTEEIHDIVIEHTLTSVNIPVDSSVTLPTALKTLINITGAGIVNSISWYNPQASTASSGNRSNITMNVIADGITYVFNASGSNRHMLRFGVYSYADGSTASWHETSGILNQISNVNSANEHHTPAVLKFKKSLKVTYKFSQSTSVDATNTNKYNGISYILL